MSVKRLVLIGLFAGLHCLAALLLRFSSGALVPFSLVPLMVILAGLLLGSKDGAISFLVYIALGLVGLPVFAKPPYGGLTYVFQPTFGFVLGYVLAAFVIGLSSRGSPSFWRALAASLLGLACLYLVGLPYLHFALRAYTGTDFDLNKLLAVAFWPFIGFDILKAIAAAGIATKVLKRLPAHRSSRLP